MLELPLAASELLPVFARHGVRFIVVGAVAAVAAGAPVLTQDVDLLIDLEAVIESKRFANRDKDRATLPVLEETLRLQKLKAGG